MAEPAGGGRFPSPGELAIVRAGAGFRIVHPGALACYTAQENEDMMMKRFPLAISALPALAALGLAVLGQTAPAADYSGAFEAGYSYARTGGVHANSIVGGGSGLVSFGPVNVQVDGGVNRQSMDGEHGTGWNGVLDGFWRDNKGTLGLSISYGAPQWADALHSQGYGLFGEWYLWPDLTLRGKGGWTNLRYAGDSSKGGFGGFAAEYYIIPDLGLSAGGDYTSVRGLNVRTATFGTEYLFSRDWPLSMKLSYDYQKYGNASISSYMIRLKYRLGSEGALVELDRSGPAVWTGASPLLTGQGTILVSRAQR